MELGKRERSDAHAPRLAADMRKTGGSVMPNFSPELIRIMRTALDEVMTKIPGDQATPAIKAHMAEIILKTAAEGQTTRDGLLAAAADQIQTILSPLT
jgi:hypothetical protein